LDSVKVIRITEVTSTGPDLGAEITLADKTTRHDGYKNIDGLN
jgi:hypothetical protein